MEICKQADPNSPFLVTGTFTFTIGDQTYGPLHAGSCTQPIPEPAGTLTVNESPQSGYTLTKVSAYPNNRLISSANVNNPGKGGSATVSVVAGAVSTETIVTFYNSAYITPAQVAGVAKPQVRYVTRTRTHINYVTRTQTHVNYITRTQTRIKTVVRYVTQVRYRTVTRVRTVTQVRTVVNNKVVYTPKVRYITRVQYKVKQIIQHKTVVSVVGGYQYHRHPTTGRFAGPATRWSGAIPADEARLSIARLNIGWAPIWARDYVVNRDGSLAYKIVPFYGVTRFSASARFGQSGLTLVSGHDDIYGNIFRNLGALRLGDQIHVAQGKHAYTYVVTSTQVVAPDNVTMLNATRTRPTLALISCTPYMVDTHRVVVIAEMR